LVDFLRFRGCLVDGVSDIGSAVEQLTCHTYNLLIIEASLPGNGCVELVNQVSRRYPTLKMILICEETQLQSLTGEIGDAVFFVFVKPITDWEAFERIARHALALQQLTRERTYLMQHLAEVGKSLSDQIVALNRKYERLERLCRLLIESSRDGIVLLDGEGTVVDINDKACAMLDTARRDLVSKNPCRDVSDPRVSSLFREVWGELESTEECRFITDFRPREGGERRLEISGFSVISEGLHQRLVYLRDMTESQTGVRERTLKAEREPMRWDCRLTFERLPDMYFHIDAASMEFTYLSPSAQGITGFTLDQLYSMGLEGFVSHLHPDDVAPFRDKWLKLTERRGEAEHPFTLRYRFIRSDGDIVWLEDRRYPTYDVDGMLIAVDGVIRDVTRDTADGTSERDERIRQEVVSRTAALAESERRLRQLFEEAGDALFTSDVEGRLLALNRRGRELFGCDLDEINRVGFGSLLDETSRRKFNRALRVSFDRGQRPAPYQIEYHSPEGRKFLLEIQTSPMFTGDQIEYVLHTARDLTARRRTMQALKSLKEFNEEIVRSMSEGIFVENDAGVCQFVNPAMADMLGAGIDESIGCRILEFIEPEERDYVISQTEIRRRRGSTRYETRLRTKDGRMVPVLISSRARYEKERQIGGLSVVTDLTEIKEMERRQRMMERLLADERRLADIGMLAAGIAHNINNPLAAISGYAQTLKIKDPRPRELGFILEEVRKIEEITNNLLIKSRSEQDKNIRPIDINQLVKTELKFLEANIAFKSGVECTVELDRDIPLVSGVYSEFSQVFSNIFNNALDAMHGQREKKLRVVTRLVGDEIHLEIIDNGKGIPPENLERIFTPFFTTKPLVGDAHCEDPTGTGLGLSTARELISQRGGTIEVESELGKGSLFRVRVPISGAENGRRSDGFAPQPPESGTPFDFDDDYQPDRLPNRGDRESDAVRET